MAGAKDPQTDRELLMRLDERLDNLSQSIDRFSGVLKDFEEKKITSLEVRVEAIEDWRLKIAGGWWIMVVIWTVFSAGGIIALIKFFFK